MHDGVLFGDTTKMLDYQSHNEPHNYRRQTAHLTSVRLQIAVRYCKMSFSSFTFFSDFLGRYDINKCIGIPKN